METYKTTLYEVSLNAEDMDIEVKTLHNVEWRDGLYYNEIGQFFTAKLYPYKGHEGFMFYLTDREELIPEITAKLLLDAFEYNHLQYEHHLKEAQKHDRNADKLMNKI